MDHSLCRYWGKWKLPLLCSLRINRISFPMKGPESNSKAISPLPHQGIQRVTCSLMAPTILPILCVSGQIKQTDDSFRDNPVFIGELMGVSGRFARKLPHCRLSINKQNFSPLPKLLSALFTRAQKGPPPYLSDGWHEHQVTVAGATMT